MPWDVMHDEKGYWVVKEGTSEKVHDKPHKTRQEAVEHQRALYAAEEIPDKDPRRPNPKKFKRKSTSGPMEY